VAKKIRDTRRDFLKKMGLAATGVAASGAVAGCAEEAACADGQEAPADADGGSGNDFSAALPQEWDREADVVVAGTGFAGMTAAITAHDDGAGVLILEKMSRELEGGNSKVSGNMWWTPTDVSEGVKYIKAMSYGLTGDECIQALAEEMTTLNEWLASTVGVTPTPLGLFEPEYPELPGSDSVRTWNNGGMMAVAQGAALWTPMRENVDSRGIEILYETPARELIQDPATGQVVGIFAESGGERIAIKARKAVILACGGFEFNFEMQGQFLPGWPVYGQGSPGNTGDGIAMAQKAGAAIWHMNNALAHVGGIVVPEYDPVVIPLSFPGTGYILVDSSGERFMNEMRPNRHGFGHKEILFQFDGLKQTFPQLPCYAIFDEATRLSGPLTSARRFGWFHWHMGYQWSADNSAEVEKGWIEKGETLAELAAAFGMDPNTLAATVDRYNEFCAAGSDTDFGRQFLTALSTAPYYGVAVYPIMYNTQGGPRRNQRCQIVDPSNQPILRLYSAGELGSFWGWMYNGGGNVCECMCTGRIAARNAVAENPWA
jgi:succinate dehydrogenase/fumarate reductase flavoprotein subunit